jgi:hypothetical protein
MADTIYEVRECPANISQKKRDIACIFHKSSHDVAFTKETGLKNAGYGRKNLPKNQFLKGRVKRKEVI